MATVSQFNFNLRELALLLVKQQGLHEGRWQIGVNFGFGAGNIGGSPEEAKPSAIIQVAGLALIRQDDAVPDSPLIIDAAKENPA